MRAIRQVAMQQLFLPPTAEYEPAENASKAGPRISVGGHELIIPQSDSGDSETTFPEAPSVPLAASPDFAAEIREFRAEEADLPVPVPPADSGLTDTLSPAADIQKRTDEDDMLVWWETDLARQMLRNRPAVSMTLQQALSLALTEAPELQVLHSDWYIQQTEVDRLNAAFDWTTFIDAVWNRDSTPVSSTLDGATNRLRSRTLNASAGVRRLSIDGSQIELSQSAGLRNSNSQFISPNNQANSRLSLQYERPLLRGAGEDYNTSPQRLAEIQKDAAFDRFQAGVQDHLLRVATAYWTLVLRRGRFVQAVRSWQRATEIADEMAGRTEVDVTQNMLDRARSEVATRLAVAVETEHDILRTQNSLLRLVYGARFSDFANSEVVTATFPMRPVPSIAPEPQIERALQNRSEVHQAIREIRSASIRYNVAASEVLPALNLVLTSYVAGLNGDNDIGQSFARQFSEGEPGVGVGLNFEIPYRNRAAQAFAEQTHIGMKRVQAQLQATLGQVTEDVRDQVVQRNKFGSVLEQRWESLARAKRILEYTKTRREVLADGTDVADLYLENLLSMQSRLEDAEATYLESQIRYTLADNALLRAVSELETLAQSSPQQEECQSCLSESGSPTDGPETPTRNIMEMKSGHSLGTGHSEISVKQNEKTDERAVADDGEQALSFGHTLK